MDYNGGMTIGEFYTPEKTSIITLLSQVEVKVLNLFKRKKDLPNTTFGKVKLFGRRWSTSVKASISLWGKEYSLNCILIAEKEHPEINQGQEDVFRRFTQNSSYISKGVERIVADYFGTTDAALLTSKFGPYELMISPNAECAIVANNADDEEMDDVLPGLAVVVYPKMAIFTEEDYSEYVLFSGSDEIKAELYGGE